MIRYFNSVGRHLLSKSSISVGFIKARVGVVFVRVLFVCVGNTCRSQMAEALARNLGYVSASAGTHPGGKVAENAISVVQELGISMEGQFPKSIDDIDESGFDVIISMGCGVECPNLPIDEDWGLDDLVGMPIEAYRETRDMIRSRLSDLSN